MKRTQTLRAVALAAALLLLPAGLAACGEYSPVTDGADEQTTAPDDGPDTSDSETDEEEDDETDAQDSTEEATEPVDESAPPVADAPDQPITRIGSGSPRSGGSGGTGGSGGGGGGGSTLPPPVVYTWGLPPSDESPSGFDGPLYNSLRNGCRLAIEHLDDTKSEQMWQISSGSGPRYVVMYVAGLAYCLNRADVGATYFSGALKAYGTENFDRVDISDDEATQGQPKVPQNEPPGWGEPSCDLYRVLLSTRDQIPLDTIPCMRGGTTPNFVQENNLGGFQVYDDPCTFGVDESDAAATTSIELATSYCGPITATSLALARATTTDAEAAVVLFGGVDVAALQASIDAITAYVPPFPPAPFVAEEAVGVQSTASTSEEAPTEDALAFVEVGAGQEPAPLPEPAEVAGEPARPTETTTEVVDRSGEDVSTAQEPAVAAEPQTSEAAPEATATLDAVAEETEAGD
ncbi:MAG: hypothetical protein ABWY55_06385 [Microbacterium sp.]